jgi:hypothetical protein
MNQTAGKPSVYCGSIGGKPRRELAEFPKLQPEIRKNQKFISKTPLALFVQLRKCVFTLFDFVTPGVSPGVISVASWH